MSHRFAILGDKFLLDGQPFQIRSAELHYNRIPRAYWRERMLQAKAMGLNTVCTYVFWNEHETSPDTWNFEGNLDVRAFIELAHELGLWVLLRPGPYVCSEWDWGGFPAWLATIPNIQIRQNNPEFLACSDKYLRKVGEITSDLTIERGGPIIMVQVENEYGSFGNDHEYMRAIQNQIRNAGFDGVLFTSDGPTPEMLAGGTLPDVLSVVNFGSRPGERFAEFAKFRQNVPFMCGELWFGWFDHWGQEHHVTDTNLQALDLRWFMENNASFNIYMLHGGTNWNYMNGANWTPEGYRPDVSSYDYDSAISEDGTLTEKYQAFRSVIADFVGDLPAPPTTTPCEAIPEFTFGESCLFQQLIEKGETGYKSMEELGQGYGYVLYRLRLDTPGEGSLTLEGLQDYAVVIADGIVQGTLDRRLGQKELSVKHKGEIDVLVENTGRINYAKEMLQERKGISCASFDGEPLTNVVSYSINTDKAQFISESNPTVPALYRATFELKEAVDTHLNTSGWGKGNVWINGFNLGRHWNIGPQQTTFCPAPMLKQGTNVIIVSDLLPGQKRTVEGLVNPILG